MPDIKKRVTEDTIEINGRKFVMKKFDPMLGNYILLTASSMLLPFGISDSLSKAFGVEIAKDKEMSKEKFLEFQRDVLSVCYERLPAGDAPILTANGYGVDGVTTKILLEILISCLIFNFSDFFEEDNLTSEE